MARRNNTSKEFQLVHSGDFISVYSNTELGIVYSKFEDSPTRLKDFKYSDAEYKIAAWGEDNLLPQKRESIVKDNNIVPELIATKRGIILGQGLQAFKTEYIDGKKTRTLIPMPPETQDFLDATGWDDYALIAAGELLKHGNVFPEFVRSKDFNKITSFKAHFTKNIRAGKQNKDGVVEKYYWHGSWAQEAEDKQKPKAIPLYNPDKKQLLYLMHLGDPLFFDGYYYYPAYWGGKEWIELSNIIPKWQKANLDNGYSIRFHIRIPKDYFLNKTAWKAAANKKQQEKCISDATAAEEEFIEQMNNFLAGVNGAGRAVYTKYEDGIDEIKKTFPGIEIIPIKVDMKDEALLKLFEKSNDANISAQGIHPSLASIQVQGKMSAGAEIRNALLSYIAIKTHLIRKLILKPLYHVKKINGWAADIDFQFIDIEIEKLDENKAGQSQKIEGQQI